jgi:IclR family transcriptional regulator, acetate operon repressor
MLGRVLALLDAVSAAPNVNRRDLAVRSGLAPATCNRIVAGLIKERLLVDGPAGLRLGLRLFELGMQAGQEGVTLLDAAGPYLLDLHAVFGWTVQLGVLDGGFVTYLMKVDSRRHRGLETRVAGRFPPHCTGAGKALLAYSSGETVDQLLDGNPLISRTPATITDRALLMRDLRTTRRRAYAIDRGEFQAGMTSIAVPIRMSTVPVAALTLSGPSGVLDPVRAAHAARVVVRMIEARIVASGTG